MSEHTLSGLDLTNGKRVNFNFTSGDLLPNTGLFDTTKIAKDLTEKSNKNKSNTEKVDTFVQKVEESSPYETLSEAYGGIEKLPTDFKPILGIKDSSNILSEILGDESKRVVDTRFNIKDLKPNEEIRLIPFTKPEDQKYYVADKRAPGPFTLAGTFASLIDTLSGQRTDLDKLGTKFQMRAKGIKDRQINLADPSIYKLSKIEENLINRELETQGIDTVEEGATSGVDENIDKSIEQQQKQSKFERGERLKEALQAAGVNIATMPIYTRLLEDAAKRRLELDKAMLGAREMMPSNIQNIMASKQAQRSLASSAFAEELKAVAAQQDAATKFAGLGMQRSFGQPNVGNFKLG